MLRKGFGLSILIIAVFFMPLTGCASAMRVKLCPPDAIVSTEMINFVCPHCGASYQAYAVMCAGETRYRVDATCPVCGFNYRYHISQWPYPYVWSDFYFYSGWWYSRDYWGPNWRYPYYPPIVITPPRPPIRPPIRPPATSPPGIGRGDRGRIDTPPPRSGVQHPPVPPRPQAPRVERPAPTSRPPSPPPVKVRPRPESPQGPRGGGRPPNY